MVAGREALCASSVWERRPLQMDFTDHQCTGDRTFCSTSSLFAYNVGITPPLQNITWHNQMLIGIISLLQHHLGFLPYATLYVLNTFNWDCWNIYFVACQYDKPDEELLNANLASWLHLAAGTDAGKVERWVAHDRTGYAGMAIMLNRTSKNVRKLNVHGQWPFI